MLERVNDTSDGYGWVSIALHWFTAAVVLTMFVVGIMSQSAAREDYARLVHLHTTIGVTAYALLWGRIIHRFVVGHPGPLPKQGVALFTIGKYFHFVFLIAIGVMLVSGPFVAWLAGDAIHVFGLEIPTPFPKLVRTQQFVRAIHGYTASFILAGFVLHMLAVFKHTVINRDGTFDKIMMAAREPSVAADRGKAKV